MSVGEPMSSRVSRPNAQPPSNQNRILLGNNGGLLLRNPLNNFANVQVQGVIPGREGMELLNFYRMAAVESISQVDPNGIIYSMENGPIKTPGRVKKFIKIESSLDFSKVAWNNEKPKDENLEMHYICPICFRYFEKILEFSCCQNYICHFCVEELNNKVQTSATTHEVKCPFCSNEKVVAQDIDENKSVRIYTDSPLKKKEKKSKEASPEKENENGAMPRIRLDFGQNETNGGNGGSGCNGVNGEDQENNNGEQSNHSEALRAESPEIQKSLSFIEESQV